MGRAHGTNPNTRAFEQSAARSGAEAVLGFCEAEHGTPDEAVDSDDHECHDDGGEQEDGEGSVIGGGADFCAEAEGRERAVMDAEVFGDDAGVSTRRRMR